MNTMATLSTKLRQSKRQSRPLAREALGSIILNFLKQASMKALKNHFRLRNQPIHLSVANKKTWAQKRKNSQKSAKNRNLTKRKMNLKRSKPLSNKKFPKLMTRQKARKLLQSIRIQLRLVPRRPLLICALEATSSDRAHLQPRNVNLQNKMSSLWKNAKQNTIRFRSRWKSSRLLRLQLLN